MGFELKILSTEGSHAEVFYKWRNQPSSVDHNPLMPSTQDECRKRLDNECSNLDELWSGKNFRWFFELQAQVVSNFSLKNINKVMLTAEIGYGVGEEFQGRGIGKRTVKMMVSKIFTETKLRKLTALVHDENIPSCRLLESIGFVREGLLREHFLINNKPANEIAFGLLRKDWERLNVG